MIFDEKKTIIYFSKGGWNLHWSSLITLFSTLLCPVHYCVQQSTVYTCQNVYLFNINMLRSYHAVPANDLSNNCTFTLHIFHVYYFSQVWEQKNCNVSSTWCEIFQHRKLLFIPFWWVFSLNWSQWEFF